VCGWGEDCQACPLDCGDCVSRLGLWFTQPLADAAVALDEATLGDLERALVADLDGAAHSIEVAVYDLGRARIGASLASAARRGVRVRVVTECENRTPARSALWAELEAAGATVRDDRSSFAGLDADCPEDGGEMHHKFVVVDRHLVWAGSMNLTATDLNYNHNHAFRIEDEAVAHEFAHEWEDLWAGRFGRAKAPRTPRVLEVASARLEIGFSPRRAERGGEVSVTRELVLGSLRAATASVAFALFALTDAAVGAALEQQAERVRGVVDATLAAHASARVAALCDQGAPLFVENLPGKVHHKLGVVDGEGPRPVVLGGSCNWSASGFDDNDETLIAVRDAALGSLASRHLEELLDDDAHRRSPCCFHAAEAYDGASARCGDRPCVCDNGLDDDFDGRTDDADSGCAAAFACEP